MKCARGAGWELLVYPGHEDGLCREWEWSERRSVGVGGPLVVP